MNSVVTKLVGVMIAVVGLVMIALGAQWAAAALSLVPDSALGILFELVIPFVPILLIASDAWILVRSRR